IGAAAATAVAGNEKGTRTLAAAPPRKCAIQKIIQENAISGRTLGKFEGLLKAGPRSPRGDSAPHLAEEKAWLALLPPLERTVQLCSSGEYVTCCTEKACISRS